MPVWEAIYTMTIASKTGWTEEFIRHSLPLSRGWAYYHAIRFFEGEKCRWPGVETALSKHIDNVRGWIRKVTKRHQA
jgi:hypothetical protein